MMHLAATPPNASGQGLRQRLVSVLVAVTLVSVLLLGVVNYIEARSLLTSEVGSALGARGAALAAEMRSALGAIEDAASLVAGDPVLASDLEAFDRAFTELEDERDLVGPDVRRSVESYYQTEVIDRIAGAGVTPPNLEDVVPGTDAAIYLQYHYVVENPHPNGEREAMTESPTDGSAYRRVHAERHTRLDRLRSTLGFDGLMLIDPAGTIVYSTDKRIDLGTNLNTGPYRTTELASIVTERLATTPSGDAVFADFEFYVPEEARPTMFAVVAIRAEGEFKGAVAFEIPVTALNRLTTAGGRWEDVGLGTTGEVYIVGPDGLMRSESRRWIEDESAYIAAFEDNGGTADVATMMTTLGTNVLIQPVESSVVSEALDGVTTTGRAVDYLGRRSLAYAAPIGAEGLGWVIVAEISDEEAGASLRAFRVRMLVAGAILLPAAALIGFLLADRISRPIKPVVELAALIADGELESSIPDLGRNEFGDVARRIGDMAAHLRAQELELDAEEADITQMMLATLPPRVVERLRSGDHRVEDLVDTATVVSVTVSGVFDEPSVDSDTAVELGARISRRLEAEADALEIERVRSSSVHHLFLAGLGQSGPQVDVAIEFALAARRAILAEGEREGVAVGFQAGLASGTIVSSLLEGNQLSYGVFGEAVQLALTLDASASPGDIVLHETVTSAIEGEWTLGPAPAVYDVAGSEIHAVVLLDTEGATRPAH